MARYRNDEVREALLQFIGHHVAIGFVAKVASAAKAKEGLIEVEYDDMTFEVKLRAVSGSTQEGELRTPVVGSFVFCVSEGNSNNSLVVVADTEMEEYRLGFGDISCVINSDGVVFNGGDLGGIIQIEALTSKINELVGKVNDLVSSYNSHIHTTTATVGASGTPGVIMAPTAKAQPAPQFKRGDYENDKIKH